MGYDVGEVWMPKGQIVQLNEGLRSDKAEVLFPTNLRTL